MSVSRRKRGRGEERERIFNEVNEAVSIFFLLTEWAFKWRSSFHSSFATFTTHL
jgi:hypothetical protein